MPSLITQHKNYVRYCYFTRIFFNVSYYTVCTPLILSTFKSRLAINVSTFNDDLQQDAHEWLCLIYDTLERALSIPITSDINVAIFKEHVSGLINIYIICMEYKCKTTYSSTMQEIIVKIKTNIHLAIKD